ncbi:hypothetical protein B0H10DRAFT_1944436 [Mycena sp. CBHHK59/15]|nr:hypothetical protein B0H10DRAFT_1944436 [Mycena sp. CBHHK59/15]
MIPQLPGAQNTDNPGPPLVSELDDLEHTHQVLETIGAGVEDVRPIIGEVESQISALTERVAAEPVPTASNRSASPTSKLLLHGMPLTGVDPISPGFDEFTWKLHEFASTDGDDSLPSVVSPPPCPKPEHGYTYPIAKPFTLVRDKRYRRQPSFAADGQYIEKPIPGMIKATLGIPYVQRINGDPNKTVTVATLQTNRVRPLEQELYIAIFGSNPLHNDDTVLPLCKLGLRRNDRSAKPTPGSTDGSYSLGPTVEQGQGQGSFQPTVQKRISRILVIVHELQQLIMPCCLSAFEWEITKFHMLDNNVFIFGGLNGPGATGCQYNSSSGKGSLADMIGRLQGYWHADISDAWVFWTFGILLLKLPPGSDPGPFMFGRCGIYVRETGILILYLVFRGNDLHCGYAPTYDDKVKAEWIAKNKIIELYNMTDEQDRAFLVGYPTEVQYHALELWLLSRLPILCMRVLLSPTSCVKKTLRSMARLSWESHHDRYNRLGREIIWGAINALKISGLKLRCHRMIYSEQSSTKTRMEFQGARASTD